MRWFKPVKRVIKYFRSLIPNVDLTSESGELTIDSFIPARGSAHLILCTFGENEIRLALRHFGIRERLKELGYADVDIRLDSTDVDNQKLSFYGVVEQKVSSSRIHRHVTDKPLGEIIMRETKLRPAAPGFVAPREFSFLIVQWIRMQNPCLLCPPLEMLPGQDHPGLGVGKRIVELLTSLAKIRGHDGLVNRPEFLHNAVLYSRSFNYLDPTVAGRLRALQRDLPDLSLRQLSWAVERGLVLENSGNLFFRWYQSEQIWPNCRELQAWFKSEQYETIVNEQMQKYSYSLVPDGMCQLRILCKP